MEAGERCRVILVTDGDAVARQAVEVASRNVGARCISLSAGNPTILSGPDLVALIKRAPHDPVVVMLDDRGATGAGPGERALEYICRHPDIQVLGVVAVASNTTGARGVRVDESVTRTGNLVPGAVDKFGAARRPGRKLHGDTVEILNRLPVPLTVGLGDVGKMLGADDYRCGAPVTARALQEILNRSERNGSGQRSSKRTTK
ncbi:stage V sporulation protein AE [Desulfotomaculum copahuensis]|uniref:Stage V sporulation protein AE n=1 Tax=Desulfotomaculum copahuensis TaxID=1838280 RepID=A0A1B7LIQ6_9FIRM|nr:stage V sporulation protein AE [Desulfotomaculum copahuensis]OAT86455.1 stage V sporulation protein AE [Desulfotomaculum copahuensis]